MFLSRVGVAVAFLVGLAAPWAAAESAVGRFTVTAYCSCPRCCGKGAKGLTASGKHVGLGMIATDWDVLPVGTHVRLPCFPGRVFVVEDKGSAIVGNRIDVWTRSHSAALKFGVRHGMKVRIAGSAGESR